MSEIDNNWIIIVKNDPPLSTGTQLFSSKKIVKPITVIDKRFSEGQSEIYPTTKKFRDEFLYGNDPTVIEMMRWMIEDIYYAALDGIETVKINFTDFTDFTDFTYFASKLVA